VQGYTKVLELLQENLLPGLDRCTAVLSNLQGLAQYHEHSTAFDVPISSFSILLDIIRCIRLIAHHMILYASEEYHHFLAFSKWLRYAIEVQAADPTSIAGEEAIEKDPGVDYLSVLSYIQNAMEKSRIDQFISEPDQTSNLKANPNMYDDLKAALKPTKGSKANKSGFLKMSSYFSEWRHHNMALIEQITSWQRKTTIIPGAVVLIGAKPQSCDLRMVSEVSRLSFCVY
jgi:anaphase-promoting complex subunit 4